MNAFLIRRSYAPANRSDGAFPAPLTSNKAL